MGDIVETPPAASIKSPCINTCAIDPATGWCEGCRRTLDEIASWGSMSDGERERIMGALLNRTAPKGD